MKVKDLIKKLQSIEFDLLDVEINLDPCLSPKIFKFEIIEGKLFIIQGNCGL